MRIHTTLIKDGKPVLGTEYQRVHNLKTWKGVARRLLRGPRPDHAESHMYECAAYHGDSIHGKPFEVRRIKVTLTCYQIGHAIYQG